jgi:hypothetical protein
MVTKSLIGRHRLVAEGRDSDDPVVDEGRCIADQAAVAVRSLPVARAPPQVVQ